MESDQLSSQLIGEICSVIEQARAQYGKAQLKQLSGKLSHKFGKGFSVRNLRNMRTFFTAFPNRQTLSTKLGRSESVFKELGFIEQCCHSANAAMPFFRERGDFTDWVFPRLSQNEGINIPQNIQYLLEVIKMSPHLSAPKLAQQLNISLASVERHIKWLKKHNLLQRIGAKKDGHWEVLGYGK